MSVLTITDENYETEIEKSDKVCVLDFYATWCGPCKMMSPVIDEIAEELGDMVKVGKVDSDENRMLIEKFGIMSIPTIFVIKQGEIVKKFMGVTPKNDILEAIKM